MSDVPIPEDIKQAALAVVERGYDEGLIDTVERALMAERERCLAVVAARKSIYERKLEGADISAEDNYNRHALFQHAVEAFEHLEAELGAPPPSEEEHPNV